MNIRKTVSVNGRLVNNNIICTHIIIYNVIPNGRIIPRYGLYIVRGSRFDTGF